MQKETRVRMAQIEAQIKCSKEAVRTNILISFNAFILHNTTVVYFKVERQVNFH